MPTQPKWKIVEYNPSEIIKAGKTIRDEQTTEDQLKNAIAVIDNWRAAHAFPMHVIYMHLRRMAEKRKGVVVAERLKRLESIIDKLRREQSMSLWTMQDLGGCRVIANTVEEVYEFAQAYKNSRKRHIFKKEKDYIATPRTSGYRSFHAVYQYHSDKSTDYNRNMLVEIQFRTRLQHLWATAVETMGIFTKQAIKSGQGTEDVKRFFILVSSLFALRENQPVVPNTSSNINDLIAEIKMLEKKNHYLDFLRGIQVVTSHDSKSDRQTGYYILHLNYVTRRLRVFVYNPGEIEKANAKYNEIEHSKNDEQTDTVLVRVSSFANLRSAYPNYFADIGNFIDILSDCLGNKKKM